MSKLFTLNQALLLIECQNEWLNPQGKLHHLMQDKEQFEESASNLTHVLRQARARGLKVIHSDLRFQEGYPELAGGKCGLRDAIPEAGTFQENSWNSQFYPSLQPIAGEFIVRGRTGASAFSGSNLDVYLRHNGITELFLAGYALHVCVESTMRDAHDRGYLPFLIIDASAAFTAMQKAHVQEHVIHHFGQSLTTEALCKTMRKAKQLQTDVINHLHVHYKI
ncbi:isochorismatase family cysteine hydrolase [Pontibacter sp. MBLB2868]|uniref:isochorismatase family cysteine hydrolase n=1 Tax=Pontibacter sp. MBLB2868 TaxID=3451555 RepID=UPI003F74DC3A